MNGWVTIFDVTAEPFRWGNAGEGLAAVALVAFGAAAMIALHRRHRRGGTTILAVAAGLAVFFAVRTLDHRRTHQECVDALRKGDGRLVEGKIENFHPLDSIFQSPSYESFEVGGVTVRYPLLAGRCGFHRTTVEGGPIRAGMRVRITEWQGEVLKLELEKGVVAEPPHRHPPI